MKYTSLLIVVLLIAGCGSKGKKLVVMSSGALQQAGTTITIEPGTTHNELTQDYPSGTTTISIKGFPAASSAEFSESGLYLLNLKSDTLVGSIQRFGESEGTVKVSQEDLKKKVDSLQQLIVGQNISAANKNFYILPGKVQLISANTDARIYGPYVKTPSSVENGAEVYKFYTNKQMRETVDKLNKMMIAPE